MKNEDAELIQRILDGDEGAFTTLMRKYQKQVHALAWRKVGDFHVAEELTQDTFIQVYKNLPSLRNPNSFAGWLYVIANRQCIAWLRKNRLPMTSLDAMSDAEVEKLFYTRYEEEQREEAATERRREFAKSVLQRLPESERTVVTLYYLGEMTCEEISEFLGVSPNTVKSRLHRARKRLKEEEPMIRETLDNFQLSPNLAANVLREVARLKPAPPAGSRPVVPWAFAASTAIFVLLMLGLGTQYLARFQQPYSFKSTAEPTVEIVDAPVVLLQKLTPDVRTRFGQSDTPGKNSGPGEQGDALLIADAQADEADVSVPKPRWVQTNGPAGISGSEAGLFATSEKVLYAITPTRLYRLADDASAWVLVSERSGARWQSPSLSMAERGDTLYTLSFDELLASTDAGKTWDSVVTLPDKSPTELVATDEAVYLAYANLLFRYDDADKQWVRIDDGLSDISIIDIDAFGNTVFIGTDQGLYRFVDGVWEQLPVPGEQCINALEITEDRLYVLASSDIRRHMKLARESHTLSSAIEILLPLPAVFRSIDFGDSWEEITPNERVYQEVIINAEGVAERRTVRPPKSQAWTRITPADDEVLSFLPGFLNRMQFIAFGETLVVKGARNLLRSDDGGETWRALQADQYTLAHNLSPVVALDAQHFYRADFSRFGIARSTDGGNSWHTFTTGMVNTQVVKLAAVNNTLFAITPKKVLKSTDEGDSWTSVRVGSNNRALPSSHVPFNFAKIAEMGDVLYIGGLAHGFGKEPGLFRLVAGSSVFVPVEGLPDFNEPRLDAEWYVTIDAARKSGATTAYIDDIKDPRQEEMARIVEERLTNGGFALTDKTIFIEYRRKLFRWTRGQSEWHDTGLEDTTKGARANGFTLAVSGDVVYAGKRNGTLFQSLDNGDTWRDITAELPAPGYFREIVFAGPTVYVATDGGVMQSHDGDNWHLLADAEENQLVADWLAVDGTQVYGVCERGVYQVDARTGTWHQVASEIPYQVQSFAVDGKTLYIGTRQHGVVRFQLP